LIKQTLARPAERTRDPARMFRESLILGPELEKSQDPGCCENAFGYLIRAVWAPRDDGIRRPVFKHLLEFEWHVSILPISCGAAKRASASRPSREWIDDDDYDVLADGVGSAASCAPMRRRWECAGYGHWPLDGTTTASRPTAAMPHRRSSVFFIGFTSADFLISSNRGRYHAPSGWRSPPGACDAPPVGGNSAERSHGADAVIFQEYSSTITDSGLIQASVAWEPGGAPNGPTSLHLPQN
jgi:hypothetical protein